MPEGKRKFCSPKCGVAWFAKHNPNSRKEAARKYGKANRKEIHQRRVKSKWKKRGFVDYADFCKQELLKPKMCEVCGNVFYSEFPERKRCSDFCRWKDGYLKRKTAGRRVYKKRTREWVKSLPKGHPYRIRCAIASSIISRIKHAGGKKCKSTIGLVGCEIIELKKHLESKFKPGMTWDNRGLFGWHIDHIRPCSSFDLSDPEQQKACFHYTNLQPLWWDDNLKKSDRWIPPRRQ